MSSETTTTVAGRGQLLVRIGWVGLAVVALMSLVGWVLVGDLFARLGHSVGVTGDALVTIESTVDVADEALGSLSAALDSVQVVTERAVATARTVESAVSETARIVGEDIPANVEAIRTAMPGLIDASRVIDRTLTALSFIGVPYDPETPLDEAFRQLDSELQPLPEALRENSRTISDLARQAEAFEQGTAELGARIAAINRSVQAARTLIGEYRATAGEVGVAIDEARNGLTRSRNLSRLLVVAGSLVLAGAMTGMILVGRTLTDLEGRVD